MKTTDMPICPFCKFDLEATITEELSHGSVCGHFDCPQCGADIRADRTLEYYIEAQENE